MTWIANSGFNYQCEYCLDKFRRKATLLTHKCPTLKKGYQNHLINLKTGKPGRQ